MNNGGIASEGQPFRATRMKRQLYHQPPLPKLWNVAILENERQCHRMAKHHVIVDHATGAANITCAFLALPGSFLRPPPAAFLWMLAASPHTE